MFKSLFNKFKKKKKHSFYGLKKKKFKKRKGFNINFSKMLNFITNDKKNIKIIKVIILSVIISSIIFVIFGPLLKITNIPIERKDNLINIEMAYRSIEPIRGKSVFLINFDDIKKRLKDYQKNIKDINIKLLLPNTIDITIGSYKGIFNTLINGKNYIITENGVLVPTKKSSEIKDINIIYKKLYTIPILDYKKIFTSNYLNQINYLSSSLEENLLNIKIKKLNYYKNEREAHLISNNGIIMIYDLSGDIDAQVKKTVVLNKEHYNLDKPGIVYIDFRIKDKIYYCLKEIEQTCLSHLKRLYPY